MPELHLMQWGNQLDPRPSWSCLCTGKETFSHINVSSLLIALGNYLLRRPLVPTARFPKDAPGIHGNCICCAQTESRQFCTSPLPGLCHLISTLKKAEIHPMRPLYVLLIYSYSLFPLFQPSFCLVFLCFVFFFPFNPSSNCFRDVRDDDSWSRGLEMRLVLRSKWSLSQPTLLPWDRPSSPAVGHRPTPGFSDKDVPGRMLKVAREPGLQASTFICFYLQHRSPYKRK